MGRLRDDPALCYEVEGVLNDLVLKHCYRDEAIMRLCDLFDRHLAGSREHLTPTDRAPTSLLDIAEDKRMPPRARWSACLAAWREERRRGELSRARAAAIPPAAVHYTPMDQFPDAPPPTVTGGDFVPGVDGAPPTATLMVPVVPQHEWQDGGTNDPTHLVCKHCGIEASPYGKPRPCRRAPTPSLDGPACGFCGGSGGFTGSGGICTPCGGTGRTPPAK